jgi:hypothetical protein
MTAPPLLPQDLNGNGDKTANGHRATPFNVAALADARRLRPDFLHGLGLQDDIPRGTVKIPYFDVTGQLIAYKRRTAHAARDGSWWPKGLPLAAYGGERIGDANKSGFLVIVEGESDCWALWHHGVPALGLAGANTARHTLEREHVEAVDTIYVQVEPDQGGQKFLAGVTDRLRQLGFQGKVFALRMPAGIKDACDLHAADPAGFEVAIGEALKSSELVSAGSLYQDAQAEEDGPNHSDAQESDSDPVPWGQPIPLNDEVATPPFPTKLLPDWLRDWVEAEATATQTPVDLAAGLTLSVIAAAIARKFRVQIRPSWTEPVNLFVVVVLPSGERKSSVFTAATKPVAMFEAAEIDRAAASIAEAASEHRMLEAALKVAEAKAVKATDAAAQELRREAKDLAKDLAAHRIPDPPQLFCDDATPEKLANMLARQGGRMLMASAEGTAFEIAKGRYSEGCNIDVFLKGHSGDYLRVNRIGREADHVDQPALTLCLAVQPDVVVGLSQNTTMRGRGFLARFLYLLPASLVGAREIAPRPVPRDVQGRFEKNLLSLWKLNGAVSDDGRPAPHCLRFSKAADSAMRDFERELEPQLSPDGDLAHLAGWANKLAGAVARIAAVLHMAGTAADDNQWQAVIPRKTVKAAIALGKFYFLPHARAAFGAMGADEDLENAKVLWASICKNLGNAHGAHSAHIPLRFSRRDAHNWNRRKFKRAEDLDPILTILSERTVLRLVPGSGAKGRGKKSPEYEVNPIAFAAFWEMGGRPHCAHRAHFDDIEDDLQDDLEADGQEEPPVQDDMLDDPFPA